MEKIPQYYYSGNLSHCAAFKLENLNDDALGETFPSPTLTPSVQDTSSLKKLDFPFVSNNLSFKKTPLEARYTSTSMTLYYSNSNTTSP